MEDFGDLEKLIFLSLQSQAIAMLSGSFTTEQYRDKMGIVCERKGSSGPSLEKIDNLIRKFFTFRI